jgi:hypothetical protein
MQKTLEKGGRKESDGNDGYYGSHMELVAYYIYGSEEQG